MLVFFSLWDYGSPRGEPNNRGPFGELGTGGISGRSPRLKELSRGYGCSYMTERIIILPVLGKVLGVIGPVLPSLIARLTDLGRASS